MSSERIRVQTLIRQQLPLAVFTHCVGYRLNLVISHFRGIPTIQNPADQIKNACMFSLNSSKWNQHSIES